MIRGLVIAVASRCRAQAPGARTSVVAARRLSSYITWAQLFLCLWDPPDPGIEPMSPALAGGLLATAPPGKSRVLFCFVLFLIFIYLFGYARSLDLGFSMWNLLA